MTITKRLFCLAISFGAGIFLFFYLAETIFIWRFILSLLVLISSYVMVTGFLSRG